MKAMRLGDMSTISYGYTAKASHAKLGPRFLRITDIQNGAVDWDCVPTCMISQEDIEKHRLVDGDIVFARTGATTGKSYRIAGAPEAVPASYLIRVRITKSDVDPRFVELFFQTRPYWDMVKLGTSGSAQGGFNASKLAELRIPIPPLPEQKRIVAILDEAFAGIATAVANTEKNLANARELFESYLNSVFSQREDGWIEKPLGECFRLRSGDALTNSRMVPGDFSVFGGNGIAGTHNQNNLVGENVIIGRVGALCGNARYIDEPIWLTDNAFKVVDKKYAVYDRFLVYLLNFKNLRRYARQSAQPVISNSSLRDVELCFPKSESEQRRLVVRLDELDADIGRLSSVYQQKLIALAELKQSLLQKAFSGELTAGKAASDTIRKAEEVA